MPSASDVDPSVLADLASRVALDAGALLLDGLGRVRRHVGTKSSPTDMVTEMDRASEQRIVAGILAERPDDGIVGEEGTDRPGRSRVRWIVDPLDGTTNYLYGHPGFGVSIAAESGGVVVAGAVYDPIHDQLFTATLGGGARLGDEPIRTSGATDLATSLVATGFSYDPIRRGLQAGVLVKVLPWVRDIRRMGAAAVDLCSVACGRVDAFYERGLARWDLAAGGLIAAEAGAVVMSLDGADPAAGGTVVASAPGIAAALHDLLAEAGADQA